MKKLFSFLALSCIGLGASAQTVIARMGDLVNNGTNNGVSEAVKWTASEDKVYSFDGLHFFSGITNSTVLSALVEGDKYVTVAMYVYGNNLNGSPFSYGDNNDGLKYTFFGNTSVQVTTKSVQDFGQETLGTMTADEWNLVAFTVPGKALTSATQSRYISPAGFYTRNYTLNSGNSGNGMKEPADASKKFAIGSGNQGDVREAFSGLLANVTVMTSDGLLDYNTVKNAMAAAPTLAPNKDVTVTYRINGSNTDKFEKVVNLPTDVDGWVTYAAPDYYTNATSTTAQITSETTTVTVDINPAFPFEEGKFYQIKNRNQNYLKNVDAANISTKNAADNYSADMLWYFTHVENTENQYTIHSVNGGAWYGTSGKMACSTENSTPFHILKQGDYFNIYTGSGNGYAGAHSNYTDANSAVGYWGGGNATEPGSQWTLLAFDESGLVLEDAPYLGSIARTTAIETAFDDYYTNKTAATLKAALEAYAGSELVTLSPEKYYRLANYDTSRSHNNWVGTTCAADTDGAILDSSERKVKSNVADGGVAALWQFVEADGGYNLKNMNSGTCLFNSTTNDAHVTMPVDNADAGIFALNQVSGKWWTIKTKDANEWLHQSNHPDNKLLLWSGQPSLTGSQASLWSIEEVTEIPFTFNASTADATFCSPVNVTIPSGVQAFIATSVKEDENLSAGTNFLFVEEITGVIPANTGVLLIGTAGDAVNFPIAAADATLPDVATNRFVGTTVARQGFAADSHYGLKYSAEAYAKAVLAKNGTVAEVPANKAILPASVVPAASASNVLGFRFGDETVTAIENAAVNGNAIEFYDLNGKRVNNPTTGIYVTREGRKVFVK